ncbi:acylphosphatase, partial [Streptococcus pyogenes]
WNNDDGTVTILAQSDNSEKLSHFIHEIRKGPSRMSNVTYLDVSIANFQDFSDFKMSN